MPHRNLYPYWNEVFEGIEDYFSNLEELEEALSLPAAPIRPGNPGPDAATSLKFSIEIGDKSVAQFQQEFHMTIRPLMKLKPNALSILLKQAVIESLSNGIDISLYMAMFYMLEMARERIPSTQSEQEYTHLAQAVCLAELVLLSANGNGWVSLTDRAIVPVTLRSAIAKTQWLPNERTLKSWDAYYAIEKFLEMRIVPMEQFLEKEDRTIPYSGYTKGYHESGSGYSRDGKVYGTGKTPFDPEIDEDLTIPPEPHHDIDDDPVYQAINQSIKKIRISRFSQGN